MIYTSSHKQFKTNKYRLVSISGNRGRDFIDDNGSQFSGECYPKLAPKLLFWKTWHDLKDKVSFEESTKYYIEHYYNEVLEKLDPEQVYNDLDNSILLCYEYSNEFCHRHIVAAWLESSLDIKVPECFYDGNKIIEVKRPEYIDIYLEEVINKIDSNNKQLIKK